MDLSKIIKEVLTIYRRDLPRKSSTPDQREWFLKAYPHLDRGPQWNRALYDFNVFNFNSPHTTGICLSLAIALKEILDDEGEDHEILFLYEVDTFCHAVVKYKGRYYDAFFPEGTPDPEKIVFADQCILTAPFKNEVQNFLTNGPVNLLKQEIYSKLS